MRLEAALDSLFVRVELVHQLHDRGDRGVEVPASAEVFSNAADGLVELALHFAGSGWQRSRLIGRKRPVDRALRRRFTPDNTLAALCARRHIARDVAIDARQKAADAFDAGVLPVEIAIGRRGEERVHARGIGAIPARPCRRARPRCPGSSTSWRRL